MKKTKYAEPTDYIPKSIRKELKLGEYAEEETESKKEKRELNKEIRDYVKNNK